MIDKYCVFGHQFSDTGSTISFDGGAALQAVTKCAQCGQEGRREIGPHEDIMRMARASGIGVQPAAILLPFLKRFHDLAVANEREACANLCTELGQGMLRSGKLQAGAVSKRIAEAIRARTTP